MQDVAASGRCCVLDIDVQGARLVRRSGLRAVFVFVAPPSSEELERRLRGRGTEGEEQIAERLATAKQEIARHASFGGAIGYLLVCLPQGGTSSKKLEGRLRVRSTKVEEQFAEFAGRLATASQDYARRVTLGWKDPRVVGLHLIVRLSTAQS